MRNGWVARKTGGVSVERLACPDYGAVDSSAPPKGILHTTEGSFESALSIFRRRSAPHFLVGRDGRGRVRVVQLVQLGRVAGTLVNRAGGVETNRGVRVQVEIVGFSQKTPWLPDPGVTDALARLMAHLVDAAGIPLQHPRVNRDVARWATAVGWLGHADVPENDHWDPGALKWSTLLRLAEQYRAGARPVIAPRRIPRWAWQLDRWFAARPAVRGRRPGPTKLPRWFWPWRKWLRDPSRKGA